MQPRLTRISVTGTDTQTLDPVDGTKGFLRNDQYAVALGLVQDGRVVLGVLGCPCLPHPSVLHGICRVCLVFVMFNMSPWHVKALRCLLTPRVPAACLWPS